MRIPFKGKRIKVLSRLFLGAAMIGGGYMGYNKLQADDVENRAIAEQALVEAGYKVHDAGVPHNIFSALPGGGYSAGTARCDGGGAGDPYIPLIASERVEKFVVQNPDGKFAAAIVCVRLGGARFYEVPLDGSIDIEAGKHALEAEGYRALEFKRPYRAGKDECLADQFNREVFSVTRSDSVLAFDVAVCHGPNSRKVIKL